MGFSIKLAPGVRVRASSRGLRTSVGPRAARVHIGGGRTGFSSGVGPVGFYTSTGAGRSRGGGGSRPSTGTSARTLANAAKAEQASELANALSAIFDLHRSEFPPAQRPIAPPPPPVDIAGITAKHHKAALAGIGIFNRSARSAAKAAADHAAGAEAAAVAAADRAKHGAYQEELDRLWGRLVDNDPDVVLGTLAEAFEDNEAAAAPIGVVGSEASVVVVVPPTSAVPERLPATTAAGNLSLKKMTKRQHADIYKLLVCGYVLATVKEAFAVAPGLTHVRVVALRRAETDAYGKARIEALLAARFSRDALFGVQWATVDAAVIVNDVSTDRIARLSGPNKEFSAIDLAGEPDLAAVIAAVDLTELAG
ncbi:DUF4236 domain-containing protein [Kribbella monticola]|uniref:DUF4236 domain-containing protein n=1 Tax=Kribbella monticola TaxID=2185285 RepID=UPI000DD461DB|nr:DUF4236 domain-containing protein [Kribbella monticola]